MDDRQKESSTRATAFAAIIAALALLFVVLAWGPGSVDHVEINPGTERDAGIDREERRPAAGAEPDGGTVGSSSR